jgi:hypothetical protein
MITEYFGYIDPEILRDHGTGSPALRSQVRAWGWRCTWDWSDDGCRRRLTQGTIRPYQRGQEHGRLRAGRCETSGRPQQDADGHSGDRRSPQRDQQSPKPAVSETRRHHGGDADGQRGPAVTTTRPGSPRPAVSETRRHHGGNADGHNGTSSHRNLRSARHAVTMAGTPTATAGTGGHHNGTSSHRDTRSARHAVAMGGAGGSGREAAP